MSLNGTVISESSEEDRETALVAEFYSAIGDEIAEMLTESDVKRFCRARKWVIADAVLMATNWAVSRLKCYLCAP